jgi:ABC-2 type transport system ATP-binding protein
MIHLEHVTRRFGSLEAVRDLTLEVRKGEVFGLLGPDGAGKTTTLRMICGLLDPSAGKVEVDGLEVKRHMDEVKDRIGYMAQRFGLYGDLTVEENMFFYGDLFGVTGAERDSLMKELLAMTRMGEFRRRPAAKLSGGMKQKLALMCTLLHKPQMLLLDEPTSGVDPLSRRDFWKILQRLVSEGLTVLVTTAYLDEAERCDRVGLMHAGRLIRCEAPGAAREHVRPLCFGVQARDLRAARSWLLPQPGVIGAEPAGAELHAYLDPAAADAGALTRGLDEAALGPARIFPIDPTLEDAFIALMRSADRQGASA